MSNDIIYIPFPRELYDDVIRFSDGQVRPESVAANEVRGWLSYSVEVDYDLWGDRIEEVAEKYAPDIYEKWQTKDAAAHIDRLPLVWKEVTISAGSEVRMAYGGSHHYAKVKGGKIVDDDGAYSPSEWASKVAGGTSRNAWRDLWFKEPGRTWVPAQLLRDQAQRGDE